MIKKLLLTSIPFFVSANLFAQCTLYGIQEYFDEENYLESSQLVTVDELTGVGTPIGPKTTEWITNYDNIHFNEREQKFISLNFEEAKLHILDAKTGNLTTKNVAMDDDEFLREIILDNKNNILYGVTSIPSLVKINTSTGAFTHVGNIPQLVEMEIEISSSLYDEVSGNIFLVGQDEEAVQNDSFTIIIIDPKDASLINSFNVMEHPVLFNDISNGKIYSVFSNEVDLIEVKELNRTSMQFEDLFSLEDEYGLSFSGGYATFNPANKNLLITGTAVDATGDYNGYYIINLNSKAYVTHQLSNTTDVLGHQYGSCSGIVQSSLQPNNLNLNYSNPVSDKFTILSSEPINGEIKLYDINGQILLADNFFGKELSVNTEKIQTGIYYFEVKTDKGQLERKRIVVVK